MVFQKGCIQPPRKDHHLICACCAKLFVAKVSFAKYCSNSCKLKDRKPIRKFVCSHCKTDFYTRLYKAKYCSDKCRYHKAINPVKGNLRIYGVQRNNDRRKPNSPRIDVICLRCSIVFKVAPYRASLSKYCSRECNNESKKTYEYECEICRKIFSRYDSRSINKTCSRECSGILNASRGKKNYFFKAFANYEHHCNHCQEQDFDVLCVHHIDFDHDNHDIQNLEILCANCHVRIHRKGRDRKKKQLENILNYLKRQ